VERKLATVLFADLVGSTEFVSAQDPEVTRRRVTAWFDAVSGCIETHGGTVEKFAGDAVMAAFGIPQAHEDDAERAVRAALGIIGHAHEAGIEARIGIEAGEVVVDETDSTFATGEAVNVAARLQQAAGAGEILIGDAAHRLTEGRIESEDVGPLELRGFRRPIGAYRAVAAVDGGVQRVTVSAPFVGRESELELLENTLSRTIRDQRPHVFTVYGEPGVGKSRLLREFLAGVEGVTILTGRALPYGEGVTYWPLAEMVKAAAGITDDDPMETAREKLIECCGDEAIAELLGLASGVMDAVEGERGQPEIAWAAREFVDELADVQPLILVFEDIHWAEEPLLELIDHLAQWVRERALLVLCLARPELLDVRPGWGGGRIRSTAIELEPLAREESEELACGAACAARDLGARHLAPAREDGRQPAVRRGDRPHARRGGLGPRRPHPRHAAGADRRAHRPPAGGTEGPVAARLRDGADFLCGRARPPLRRVRRRRARGHARRPAAARPDHAAGALDDHR
jgi:class 3 adenylate cyclase